MSGCKFCELKMEHLPIPTIPCKVIRQCKQLRKSKTGIDTSRKEDPRDLQDHNFERTILLYGTVLKN